MTVEEEERFILTTGADVELVGLSGFATGVLNADVRRDSIGDACRNGVNIVPFTAVQRGIASPARQIKRIDARMSLRRCSGV